MSSSVLSALLVLSVGLKAHAQQEFPISATSGALASPDVETQASEVVAANVNINIPADVDGDADQVVAVQDEPEDVDDGDADDVADAPADDTADPPADAPADPPAVPDDTADADVDTDDVDVDVPIDVVGDDATDDTPTDDPDEPTDVSDGPDEEVTTVQELIENPLVRRKAKALGRLVPICGCSTPTDDDLQIDDVRKVSDDWMADGDEPTDVGATNMLWAWGQLLDHDLTATIDDEDGRVFDIEIADDGQKATMKLQRLVKEEGSGSGSGGSYGDRYGDRGTCRSPINTLTPLIDAGILYSPDEEYLQNTLREPNSCKMRVSDEGFLPLTTFPEPPKPGSGALPRFFFLAGDGRVNEHSVLTSMHTVWLREHNRLCDVIANSDKRYLRKMSPDEAFERVRNVVIAKFQRITFKEFLPAMGIRPADVRPSHVAKLDTADISLEFSVAAYRFGHDAVPDHVGEFKTVEIFDGEEFYVDQDGVSASIKSDANDRLDKLMRAVCTQPANKIDGRLSDTLRNLLFGDFGEDLGSRNVFRGRDVGLAQYREIAECFGVRPDEDIAQETPDAFVGMLREDRRSGKALGKTNRAIIAEQIHRVLFGREGHYWQDNMSDIKGFEHEVFETTYGKVINANTGANCPDDAFRL